MIDTTPKYPKEHVFLDGKLTELLKAVYEAGWYDHADGVASGCSIEILCKTGQRNWFLSEARMKMADGDLTRMDVWEMDAHQVPAVKEEA